MNNEGFLIVSNFAVALLAMSFGLGAYHWLRRPFSGLVKAVPAVAFRRLLRKFFPLGLLLPALAGFVSVSYRGCDAGTYAKIIENRAYLVQKNQEQVAAIADYLAVAVLVWGVVALLVLLLARSRPEQGNHVR